METTQQFGLRNASLAVDQLPLSVGWFVLSTTTDDDDDDDDVRGDDFLFSGSTTENWNAELQEKLRDEQRMGGGGEPPHHLSYCWLYKHMNSMRYISRETIEIQLRGISYSDKRSGCKGR
jgi:hypothetical protein